MAGVVQRQLLAISHYLRPSDASTTQWEVPGYPHTQFLILIHFFQKKHCTGLKSATGPIMPRCYSWQIVENGKQLKQEYIVGNIIRNTSRKQKQIKQKSDSVNKLSPHPSSALHMGSPVCSPLLLQPLLLSRLSLCSPHLLRS